MEAGGWVGFVYVNPADPRLWVRKRVGFGWTLNFAHRRARVMLLALPGVPLVVALLVLI